MNCRFAYRYEAIERVAFLVILKFTRFRVKDKSRYTFIDRMSYAVRIAYVTNVEKLFDNHAKQILICQKVCFFVV